MNFLQQLFISDIKKKIFYLFFGLLVTNVVILLLGIFFSFHYPFFLGLLTLSFGLGLKHAIDADHIAVIDNTTRKLMQEGKKPIAVGLFFSVGHATIVIILSIVIFFAAHAVENSMVRFQLTGEIIGTVVSSFFLFCIGFMNMIVFLQLLKTHKIAAKTKKRNRELQIQNKGLYARLLTPFLKTITYSWQMYPVGILFGLGFDTATEVGLLSLTALSSVKEFSFFAMLLLPFAFTSAMTLVDTVDGIVMIGIYGWAMGNPVKKLQYNLVITFVSFIFAFSIGIWGISQLLLKHLHKSYLGAIDSSLVGYFGIIIFFTLWIIFFVLYKKIKLPFLLGIIKEIKKRKN